MIVPAYGVRPGDIVVLSDDHGQTRILVTRVDADRTHVRFTGKGGTTIVPRDMKIEVK